jgi:hypothetical protein
MDAHKYSGCRTHCNSKLPVIMHGFGRLKAYSTTNRPARRIASIVYISYGTCRAVSRRGIRAIGSEIMKVASVPSETFTNNRLVRSGWRCCFRGSTVMKARSEKCYCHENTIGPHPERHGDQYVDHEQDKSFPTSIERIISVVVQTSRWSSVAYIQLVLPSAKAVKDHNAQVSILAAQSDDGGTHPG